jgi:hypothetical protein
MYIKQDKCMSASVRLNTSMYIYVEYGIHVARNSYSLKYEHPLFVIHSSATRVGWIISQMRGSDIKEYGTSLYILYGTNWERWGNALGIATG